MESFLKLHYHSIAVDEKGGFESSKVDTLQGLFITDSTVSIQIDFTVNNIQQGF